MVFHVLNRGNAKGDIFEDAEDYLAFEKVLTDVLANFSVELFSYCLMPNHWHLVLRPSRNGELGRFMQRLTVTHVRRWHQRRHSTGEGHLYQGTYKSFPVQQGDHFLTLCRYVERNALRARLVRRAENWRWSSLWKRLYPGKPSDDEMPPLSLWPTGTPKRWVDHVNAPLTAQEIEAVETSLRRGRPLGDAAWQRKTAGALRLGSTLRPRGRPRKEKYSSVARSNNVLILFSDPQG